MSISAITVFDPSKAQRRYLLDSLHGLRPDNIGGTRAGLRRRGLIDDSDRLTKVGRTLANELSAQAEASGLIWPTQNLSAAGRTREGKRQRIAALKQKIDRKSVV